MEITRENADTLLPLVESRLRGCDFFAIDLEFSGIDRDQNAKSLDDRIKALLRAPADNYETKRDAIKNYTVMQIGISVFKLCGVDASPDNAFKAVLRETDTEDSLAEVCDFFGDRESDTEKTLQVCKDLCTSWVKLLNAPAYSTRQTLATLLPAIRDACGDALRETRKEYTALSDPLSRTGIVLLRKQEFFARWAALLTAWSTRLAKDAKDSKDTHCTHNYCGCDTFYAYLFPAPRAPFENIAINTETVGTFLAENHMDFNEWICHGLRFSAMRDFLKTRSEAVASLGATADVQSLVDVCGADISALVPLSGAETAYVKWASDVPDDAELGKFRTDLLRNAVATIKFARSGDAYSSPIISTFVPATLNKPHLVALNGIGLTKRNGRYERVDALSPDEVPKAALAGATAGANADSTPSTRVPVARDEGGSALLFAILTAASTMKKPMVVHNGYTDLMMLMNILLGELPETYAEFKTKTNIFFPRLYDTRALCAVPAIQGMGNFKGPLDATYKTMTALNEAGFPGVNASEPSQSIVFAPWATAQAEWSRPAAAGNTAPRIVRKSTAASLELSAHNAGYDAFVTGCLFGMVKIALENIDADIDKYRSIVPTYSSLISIALRNKNADVYLLPQGNPVFVLDVPKGFHTIERVRTAIELDTNGAVTASVFFIGGSSYAVEMAKMPAGYDAGALMKRVVDALPQSFRSNLSLRQLDLAGAGPGVQCIDK